MQQSSISNECLEEDLKMVEESSDNIEPLPFVDDVTASSSRLGDLLNEVKERLLVLKKKMKPFWFKRYSDTLKKIAERHQKLGFNESYIKEVHDVQEYLDIYELKDMDSLQAVKTLTELVQFAKNVQDRLHRLKENMKPTLLEHYKNQIGRIMNGHDGLNFDEDGKLDLYIIQKKLDAIEHNYLSSLEERLFKSKERIKPLWYEHFKDYLRRIKEMQQKNFESDESLLLDLDLIKKHLDRIEQQDLLAEEVIVSSSEMDDFMQKVEERLHRLQGQMQPSIFQDHVEDFIRILERHPKIEYEELNRVGLNYIQKYLDKFELKNMPSLQEIRSDFQMVNYANNVRTRLYNLKNEMEDVYFSLCKNQLRLIIEVQHEFGYQEDHKQHLYEIIKILDDVEERCVPSLESSMDCSELVGFVDKVRARLLRLKCHIEPMRFELYRNNLRWIRWMLNTYMYNVAVKMDLVVIQRFLDRTEQDAPESNEDTLTDVNESGGTQGKRRNQPMEEGDNSNEVGSPPRKRANLTSSDDDDAGIEF